MKTEPAKLYLPASPAMPSTWTEAVAAAALAHATSEFPREAIGIVQAGDYVPLANVSADPENEATLSPEDTVAATTAQVLFHSHPNGLPCPSKLDMELQLQLDIPFVILPLPIGEAFAFGDTLPGRPLADRGFRHGVHDCYSLIRDWYWLERLIRLPEGPRDWNWWTTPGQNLYVDNFARAGFEAIPVAEAIRPGDLIFFRFTAPVPQHAAVVLDVARLLHHPCGAKPLDYSRPSGIAIRSRYARFAAMAVRHRDLA